MRRNTSPVKTAEAPNNHEVETRWEKAEIGDEYLRVIVPQKILTYVGRGYEGDPVYDEVGTDYLELETDNDELLRHMDFHEEDCIEGELEVLPEDEARFHYQCKRCTKSGTVIYRK